MSSRRTYPPQEANETNQPRSPRNVHWAEYEILCLIYVYFEKLRVNGSLSVDDSNDREAALEQQDITTESNDNEIWKKLKESFDSKVKDFFEALTSINGTQANYVDVFRTHMALSRKFRVITYEFASNVFVTHA